MSSDAIVIPMRQSAFDCLLRWALIAGALVDLVLGIALLICWRPLLELLGVPVPDNPSYVFLAAVFTITVALVYFVAAAAPYRYHANITIASLSRLGSGVLIAVLVWRGLLPRHIVVLAIAELILAVLHCIYSRRLAVAATAM